jgi:hypothetical protein
VNDLQIVEVRKTIEIFTNWPLIEQIDEEYKILRDQFEQREMKLTEIRRRRVEDEKFMKKQNHSEKDFERKEVHGDLRDENDSGLSDFDIPSGPIKKQ